MPIGRSLGRSLARPFRYRRDRRVVLFLIGRPNHHRKERELENRGVEFHIIWGVMPCQLRVTLRYS